MTITSLPAIKWGPEYATGVADIDAQHRVLLQCLNRLNRLVGGAEAAGRGPLRNAVRDALRDLNEYAAYHFLTEEALLREHLPTEARTVRHILAHRSYWSSIADIRMRFEAGSPDAAETLVSYLNRWWINHILETDQDMGRELKLRGVG